MFMFMFMLLVIYVSIFGRINNLITTADICFDLITKENSLWFLILKDSHL